MSEMKTCKQCNQQFNIEDDDLKFYDRISPTFVGKKYQIPSPTLCPDCRTQRRHTFRNERSLYKRKCDLCQKDIVTIYAPNYQGKVYCQDCWWSDKWEAKEFAQEIDFSKSFFDQFSELMKKVPRIALINKESENAEYGNFALRNKNSYLLVTSAECEDSFHSKRCWNCRNISDCWNCTECERCYETMDSAKCYSCSWLRNSESCTDCILGYDLMGCKNCFACYSLVNKSYHIYNKEYSKEEYETKLKELKANLPEEIKKFQALDSIPRKFMDGVQNENCSGDAVYNSKNSHVCYDSANLQDCKFVCDATKLKDGYDINNDDHSELVYEAVGSETNYMHLFNDICWFNKYLNYCSLCFNSDHLFGCVGMKKGKYSILNKEYSPEEYETLVAKIIDKMIVEGEWGEFFKISMSPFGYNETVANEYYPLTKENATKLGAKWQDEDFSLKYDGPFYQPKDIKEYINSEQERQNLLSGIIKCEVSGKPFKIVQGELAFLMANEIQIPTKHYDIRHQERLKLRNPRKLYQRDCMCEKLGHDHDGKCKVEFETTYAPNRPEKVCCELCYQKIIS